MMYNITIIRLAGSTNKEYLRVWMRNNIRNGMDGIVIYIFIVIN